MQGKTTLFVPGFDHAGISTQSVVEKRLFKTSGRTRHDLGREKFVETVMDWKNEYASIFCRYDILEYLLYSYQERITNQLHRLGGSYDWSRVAFTMSPVSSRIGLTSPHSYMFLATFESCGREFLPPTRGRYHISREPPRELVCPSQHHNLQSRGKCFYGTAWRCSN